MIKLWLFLKTENHSLQKRKCFLLSHGTLRNGQKMFIQVTHMCWNLARVASGSLLSSSYRLFKPDKLFKTPFCWVNFVWVQNFIARETVTTQELQELADITKLNNQNLKQFEWLVQDFSFHVTFIPFALSPFIFCSKQQGLRLLKLNAIVILGFDQEFLLKHNKFRHFLLAIWKIISQVDNVHLIKLFQAGLRFPAPAPAQAGRMSGCAWSPLPTSSTSTREAIPSSCSYFLGWLCFAGLAWQASKAARKWVKIFILCLFTLF